MTETVMRFDRAEFSTRKPEPDRWGNLLVDAIVCVPGVYRYQQPDGTVRREFKPPEEVYSVTHLDSVRNAVVTDEHLPGRAPVNPTNARQFTRGHGFEATQSPAGLVARMKVTDAELITEITSRRKTGVSLGLHCVIDPTSGTWRGGDGNGPPEEYDVVQRGMVTNQISVTNKPRIETAAIRMDSADAAMVVDPPQPGNATMTTMQLTVGDSTVSVDPGAGSVIQARLVALDSLITDLEGTVKTVTAERDTAQAERDTAQESLKKKEGLTIDAADIPKLVAARNALMTDASVLLQGDALKACDTLDDVAVRLAAVKANVSGDLPKETEDYVLARFDSLVIEKRKAGGDKLAAALTAPLAIVPGAEPGQTPAAAWGSRILKGLEATDSLHKQNVGGMSRK